MINNPSAKTIPTSTSAIIEARLDQVWTFINDRNVPLAQQACEKMNKEFPLDADGWYASSFLALQLKKFTIAIQYIEQAISLEPTNAHWQLQKVNTLLAMNNKIAAKNSASLLTNTKVNDIKLSCDLAMMFNQIANYPQASFYYQQAIALIDEKKQPKQSAQLYFNLATIERYQGNIDLAAQYLDQAIALNPADFEAYLLRTSLKKQKPEKNHLEQLKQLLAQGIKHPIHQAQIHYALAKELEDLTLFSESFQQLNLAAKARRSQMNYHLENDLSTLAQIRTTFDQQLFKQHRSQGYGNNEAIFILGLPRTGSTLVERIISNHSDVFSAGELNNFALCLMEQVKTITTVAPKSRTELVALTSKINFKELGKKYLASTRPETGHSKHFIDKLPLNSLYIGLIHLALPKAKIIHVTRHPLDTCYAIYKQLFTNGYPFSYDLTELAQYLIAHDKLMKHWHNQLPGIIHQVAYEDIINNISQEAKKLTDYCQLDWQAHCIDFQKNNAVSTTASATQVREKLYQSSKGKWRQFEQELTPVKDLFEQAGICCD